jgi:hypothetical protein
MTTKTVNGIQYRMSTSGQWTAQRFEVQRFIQDNHISTITGGQALHIIFSSGISHHILLSGLQQPLL